jgi:hypothetical protein
MEAYQCCGLFASLLSVLMMIYHKRAEIRREYANRLPETEPASRTPAVFFMSWFVRGKSCLFKMLLQGTGKRRGEPRPSDLQELLAIALRPQPGLQEASHPDSKRPAQIRRDEGQVWSVKVMRMLLATVRVQGNCFLQALGEYQTEALRPRGQGCSF